MAMLKVDKQWEKDQQDLVQEGTELLEERLKVKIPSKEVLVKYLDPSDREDVRAQASEVIDEINYEMHFTKEIKERRGRTLLWLEKGGAWELLKKYSIDELVWLDYFVRFWEEGLLDTEEALKNPERAYEVPNLLQWALYLTIRGKHPKGFPRYEGLYTYSIFRLVLLLDRMSTSDYNLFPLDDKAKAFLNIRLKEFKYDGRALIKEVNPEEAKVMRKEEGIQEAKLKAERKEVQRALHSSTTLPLEIKHKVNLLLKEGKSVEEISASFFNPPKTRSPRPVGLSGRPPLHVT